MYEGINRHHKLPLRPTRIEGPSCQQKHLLLPSSSSLFIVPFISCHQIELLSTILSAWQTTTRGVCPLPLPWQPTLPTSVNWRAFLSAAKASSPSSSLFIVPFILVCQIELLSTILSWHISKPQQGESVPCRFVPGNPCFGITLSVTQEDLTALRENKMLSTCLLDFLIQQGAPHCTLSSPTGPYNAYYIKRAKEELFLSVGVPLKKPNNKQHVRKIAKIRVICKSVQHCQYKFQNCDPSHIWSTFFCGNHPTIRKFESRILQQHHLLWFTSAFHKNLKAT